MIRRFSCRKRRNEKKRINLLCPVSSQTVADDIFIFPFFLLLSFRERFSFFFASFRFCIEISGIKHTDCIFEKRQTAVNWCPVCLRERVYECAVARNQIRCSQKPKITETESKKKKNLPHAYFVAQISSLRWTFISAQYNGNQNQSLKTKENRIVYFFFFLFLFNYIRANKSRSNLLKKKLGKKSLKWSGRIVRCNKLRSSGVNNFTFSGGMKKKMKQRTPRYIFFALIPIQCTHSTVFFFDHGKQPPRNLGSFFFLLSIHYRYRSSSLYTVV